MQEFPEPVAAIVQAHFREFQAVGAVFRPEGEFRVLSHVGVMEILEILPGRHRDLLAVQDLAQVVFGEFWIVPPVGMPAAKPGPGAPHILAMAAGQGTARVALAVGALMVCCAGCCDRHPPALTAFRPVHDLAAILAVIGDERIFIQCSLPLDSQFLTAARQSFIGLPLPTTQPQDS